jgi:hypothetical protein
LLERLAHFDEGGFPRLEIPPTFLADADQVIE